MTISVVATSKEYVYSPVTIEGAVRATVETWTAEFAFPVTGAQPATWLAGEWATTAAVLTARILVGPSGGAVTFAVGDRRDVYVRVTGGTQATVFLVGQLLAGALGAYSGDPSVSTKDAARFNLGDTGPTFEFTDAEVAYAVTAAGGVLLGAAQLAEVAAGRYASKAQSEAAGDLNVNWGDRSARMMALAARLRDRAMSDPGATEGPLGLGLADVLADPPTPFVWRGVHDHPSAPGPDVDPARGW